MTIKIEKAGFLSALILFAGFLCNYYTPNSTLADWKMSQQPQIVTQSASQSGMAAIMTFNKISSGSSSSSIYTSSSTAKYPYEHITSSNINPLQLPENPLASRTNTNNVDAVTYTTATTGNTGFTHTTHTIQPRTTTSESSHAQQQNPTLPEVSTQGPSQVTTVTRSLGGQITCNPTELLPNSKCSPQSLTCGSIGISEDSKCSTRPLYMLMSIR